MFPFDKNFKISIQYEIFVRVFKGVWIFVQREFGFCVNYEQEDLVCQFMNVAVFNHHQVIRQIHEIAFYLI